MPDSARLAHLQRRAIVRDGLQQSDAGSLDARVERLLSLEALPVIPATPFSTASSECLDLYRDGHHSGCISLCQSIAEALIRYLCEMNKIVPKKFERNLRCLRKEDLVDDEFELDAARIWDRRNDFHHLNTNVPTDREDLAKLSRDKVEALVRLEKKVFSSSISAGVISAENPEYWSSNPDGTSQVFLRIS